VSKTATETPSHAPDAVASPRKRAGSSHSQTSNAMQEDASPKSTSSARVPVQLVPAAKHGGDHPTSPQKDDDLSRPTISDLAKKRAERFGIPVKTEQVKAEVVTNKKDKKEKKERPPFDPELEKKKAERAAKFGTSYIPKPDFNDPEAKKAYFEAKKQAKQEAFEAKKDEKKRKRQEELVADDPELAKKIQSRAERFGFKV